MSENPKKGRRRGKGPRISAQVDDWIPGALSKVAEIKNITVSEVIRRYLIAGVKGDLLKMKEEK